jgi:glycosyltransferase involved in cell wall biosynthesis
MKILLISPSMGNYGGMEAFALALGDWINRQTSHEVRLCFKLVGQANAAERLVERIRALGVDVTFARRASPMLLRLCRWADVVHCNNASPDIVLAAKLTRRPLVLTIHNYLRDRLHWRNRLWYAAAGLADWRTYNSRFVRETWEGRSVRQDSEVVPAVSHLPEREVPITERRGFFFVARLIPNKGLETLISAYQSARIDKNEWPLLIGGEGPLRTWLERRLSGTGVLGVQYLGFLSEPDKAMRMASARWLVAPANTREDMGLTPIEARNVSVPAIVSRDGGLPEAGGPAALVCEPGDTNSLREALEAAARMKDPDYASRCVQAKDSLRTYLFPMMHYVDIYQRQLERRRGAAPN